MSLDELSYGGRVVEALADRHPGDQQRETDWNQPHQVEPLVAAHPQFRRGGPPGEVKSAAVVLYIDDVVGFVHLGAVALLQLHLHVDDVGGYVNMVGGVCRYDVGLGQIDAPLGAISVRGRHAAELTRDAIVTAVNIGETLAVNYLVMAGFSQAVHGCLRNL